MEIALFISTVNITSLIEKVKNCLLEWTIELEGKGILGENMTFNEKEAESAKGISQQINNYYGTVVNGNVTLSIFTTAIPFAQELIIVSSAERPFMLAP